MWWPRYPPPPLSSSNRYRPVPDLDRRNPYRRYGRSRRHRYQYPPHPPSPTRMGMVGSFLMWIWKCVRRRYPSRKIPVRRGYLLLFNVVIRSIPSIKGRYRPPILCKSVRAYPMKRCIIVLTESHHNVRLFYPVVVLPILIQFHPPSSWRHRPFPSIFHPPSSWRHRPVPSNFHLPPNHYQPIIV